MVNKELNAKGQFVLKWQEHLLCSKFDPLRDAQSWVSSVGDEVREQDYIVVLGLGAGHHIFELRKAFSDKKILVIEQKREIYEFHQNYNSIELSKIQVICVDNPGELKKWSVIKRVLNSTYSVLIHQPSARLWMSDYKELQSTLLLRSPESAGAMLSLREGLDGFVDKRKLMKLSDTKELVSIKMLLKSLWRDKYDEEQRIFMALGELVK